jgi:glucose-6-phosphate isomerase
MGQFVQEGTKTLFETTIKINSPLKDFKFEKEDDDSDGLNYLDGMTMDYVNSQAQKAVVYAHKSGNVGSIILSFDEINAYNFGYLVYFFMFSCAISGYILGVNPFDQEGVEAYKKNMFALLGKKGYEKLRAELESNEI